MESPSVWVKSLMLQTFFMTLWLEYNCNIVWSVLIPMQICHNIKHACGMINRREKWGETQGEKPWGTTRGRNHGEQPGGRNHGEQPGGRNHGEQPGQRNHWEQPGWRNHGEQPGGRNKEIEIEEKISRTEKQRNYFKKEAGRREKETEIRWK